MNRIFGTKKAPAPAPSLGDASSRVDSRVAAVDSKIRTLDNELREHKEALKKAKGGAAQRIKKRCFDVLRRKRMYEQQRDQLTGQQFNIDQTAFAIETAKDTMTTVEAMKAASSTLKVEHKKLNIDNIEDVQDDLAELMDEMNEVNDMLARSYGVPDDFDEADLDAELADLEDELDNLGVEDEVGAGGEPAAAAEPPAYLAPMPEEPDVPVAPVPVAAGEAPPAYPVAVPAGGGGTDEYGLPMPPPAPR